MASPVPRSMNKEWGSFLAALEAKGITFQQIQFASDRRTVIRATGFTDPLTTAVVETEWERQLGASASPREGNDEGLSGGPVITYLGRGEAGGTAFPPLDDFKLLSSLPEEVQDVVVSNEVLAAALGFGGGLIMHQASPPPHSTSTSTSGSGSVEGFVVSSHMPLPMRSLCQTVLPVADAFVAVRKVEESEYLGHSLVGMALGEIVSEIVTSYAHQITKLQRWCQTKTMPLMGVVSEILRVGHHMVRLRQVLPMDLLQQGAGAAGGEEGFASASPSSSGGGFRGPRILNHLTEQAERCAGSREDSELVQLLLRRTLVPYLKMLHRWMHEGVLADPFGEFFITEAYEPVRPAPTALTNSRRINAGRLFPELSLAAGGDYGGLLRRVTATSAASFGGSLADSRTLPSGLTREQQQAQQQQDVLNFERRFSLNKLMVPTILEKPSRMAKMVFLAGKYCCLLREYNDIRPAFGDAAEGMLVWAGVDALHRRVQESFDVANQAVIQLLFSSPVDLLGHLQSLKNFFLHEKGDWVADFLDSSEELLRTAGPDRIRAHPLRVLLQAAVARSCGASDPYHASVGCSFTDVSLAQQLARRANEGSSGGVGGASVTGGPGSSSPALSAYSRMSGGGAAGTRGEAKHYLEMLQLDVDLQWPITLVLDASTIQRFNNIFRLLTWVKVCERRLGYLWYTNEVLASFSEAYQIKHQLTHFLRQFQFYSGHFVLEPLWSRLLSKISQAESVFAISNALRDFFEHAETGLVLSSPLRFRSLSSILTLSMRFCEVGMLSSTATMPLIEATLQSMQEELLRSLSELASPIGEDYPQLVPLLTWMDFSGFYEGNDVYHVQRGGTAN